MFTYHLSCDKCEKNRRLTRIFDVKNLSLVKNSLNLRLAFWEKIFEKIIVDVPQKVAGHALETKK